MSLFSEIGRLKKLRRLILFKNALGALPDEIGDCEALEEVNVFNNKLIRLPKTMSKLKNLDDVSLSGNKLKMLPDLSNWTKVTRLAVFWNNLVMVPSFEPMSGLKELQM